MCFLFLSSTILSNSTAPLSLEKLFVYLRKYKNIFKLLLWKVLVSLLLKPCKDLGNGYTKYLNVYSFLYLSCFSWSFCIFFLLSHFSCYNNNIISIAWSIITFRMSELIYKFRLVKIRFMEIYSQCSTNNSFP